MKKLIILLLSFFLPARAFAQNWDDVVIVTGAVGTIVSTEYALYQSLVKRELKGWAAEETGTSVKLESQCGIETEFHLIGDYKRNYIMVGISNNSGEQVTLNFRRVKFIVNGTSERYPGYSYQVSDELVNNRWWMLANIPLPKKSDFAKYENLKVELPVLKAGSYKPCHVVTEFKRTAHIAKEETSYNVFDFMFDIGPSIGQSGNVKDLGDPNSIWGMNFNWYFSAAHGAGMNFQWEYGFEEAGSGRRSIFSGDFHYVYRKLVTPKLSFHFEPGIGFQGLATSGRCRNSCRSTDSESTLMLDYRLMAQYVIGDWNIADVNVMNYFVGAGLVHQYGVSGDTNGSRFGVLFRIGFGF